MCPSRVAIVAPPVRRGRVMQRHRAGTFGPSVVSIVASSTSPIVRWNCVPNWSKSRSPATCLVRAARRSPVCTSTYFSNGKIRRADALCRLLSQDGPIMSYMPRADACRSSRWDAPRVHIRSQWVRRHIRRPYRRSPPCSTHDDSVAHAWLGIAAIGGLTKARPAKRSADCAARGRAAYLVRLQIG